jgi:hypothetical protein
MVKLKSSLRKLYSRDHDLVDCYEEQTTQWLKEKEEQTTQWLKEEEQTTQWLKEKGQKD